MPAGIPRPAPAREVSRPSESSITLSGPSVNSELLTNLTMTPDPKGIHVVGRLLAPPRFLLAPQGGPKLAFFMCNHRYSFFRTTLVKGKCPELYGRVFLGQPARPLRAFELQCVVVRIKSHNRWDKYGERLVLLCPAASSTPSQKPRRPSGRRRGKVQSRKCPVAEAEPEIIRHCPSSRRVVPTFFMAVLGLFPCAMRLCTTPIPLPVNLPAGAGTSCGEPKLPNPPAPRLADVAAGVFQAAKIIRSEATGPVNVIVDTRDTGRYPPPAHAFFPHRFAWIFQSIFNFQSSPRWFLTYIAVWRNLAG